MSLVPSAAVADRACSSNRLRPVTAVVRVGALPAGARAGGGHVPASADAKVARQPQHQLRHGHTLEVDRSPVLESFVAFSVPDPGTPVTRATLRLFVVNKSEQRAEGLPLRHRLVGDGRHRWNTARPATSSWPTSGASRACHYIDYDVTPPSPAPAP